VTLRRKLEYELIGALALVFFVCVLFAFAAPQAFSDMPAHLAKHERIMAGEASTAYPVMYYASEALRVILGLPLSFAYGVFLALGAVFVLFALHWLFRRNAGAGPLPAFLGALCVSVMLHVYFPGWILSIYFGQGGGNGWLNPSFTAMKPFSVAAFILFAQLMDGLLRKKGAGEDYVLLAPPAARENALYAWFVLMCVLSLLAKPSFVFGFVFAGAILFLVRVRYFDKKFFLIMLAAGLAMGGVLLWQFSEIFKETGLHSGGVVFSPARAYHYISAMTQSVPVSLASNLLYPAVMLALFWRDIRPAKNNFYLLGWIFYGVSLVIAFTLSEVSYPEHLNMEWTKSIAIFMLNMTTTLEFLKSIKRRAKRRLGAPAKARRIYDAKLAAVLACLLLELYTGILWLGMYVWPA
jgi:hypothetical protein